MSDKDKNLFSLSSYDYILPEGLIAQRPCERREDSRMMVLNRSAGTIEHDMFKSFPGRVKQGDVLILNNTRVVPCRCHALKAGSGARLEVFFLEPFASPEPSGFKCLVSPGKRVKAGADAVFEKTKRRLRISASEGDGKRRVVVEGVDTPDALMEFLKAEADVPLPPYIERIPDSFDAQRYQTVFARRDGAVAAPTAGLHFTEEILNKTSAAGAKTARLTLHVGTGTFKPVKTEDIRRHSMDREYYEIDSNCAAEVNSCLNSKGRVICVGTTTVRALEHAAREDGTVVPGSGFTGIFIYPGRGFKAAGALLTNFHLPRSTLLMLCCAFAGRDLVMEAYNAAVKERYRFYSYGDCMLIV